MALDPKLKRYLHRFFPGLTPAIEALGPGEFLPWQVGDIKCRGNNAVRYIELNVCYQFSDGWKLELRTSSKLRPGGTPYDPATELTVDLAQWERTYYRLDYRDSAGSSAFRVDFTPSSKWGRHVHMLPDLGHTRAEEAEPDTTDLDPRDFVQWVARFRKDRTCYPLKKKKKKR